jgi:DNA processing protein
MDTNTKDWLKLALIPQVGPVRGRRLLKKFGSPSAILNASLEELTQAEGINQEVATKIIEQRQKTDLDTQLRLIEKHNIILIPFDSPVYPPNLKTIFDPPLVLFVKGEFLPRDEVSVAIVGTRLNTFYGRAMAEKFSAQLAQAGFTIISGGARGIDTFAHQAALNSGGRTIAVLGCGLDIIYPTENKALFERISREGVLISEFPMGSLPKPQNFPVRNRIISGLSLGVVVIEAPQKSGAIITASCAIEQGREVFSVPGRADTFTAKGTHQLLKEGARLAESAEDIIEELGPQIEARIKGLRQIQCAQAQVRPKQNSAALPAHTAHILSEDEKKVYRLLCGVPLHLEELVNKTRLSAARVYNLVTLLQIKGLLRQLPGNYLIRGKGNSNLKAPCSGSTGS